MQFFIRLNETCRMIGYSLLSNDVNFVEIGFKWLWSKTTFWCVPIIDLSKAFDTLTFDILLFKLKYYGVTDTALDLMRSYLTNRKQYVVFNSCQSDYSEIYTGVPQGSILGPLFFSIYINDLIDVSNRFNCLMYADDTTIYFNLEEFDHLNKEGDINGELEKVNTWLKLNKLSLNAQKTKLMFFHRKQKHVDVSQLFRFRVPVT